MAGLYDDTPGLSDGTGLWRGRLGLFSGASGFINGGGGAAYIDLYFSAGTYSVSGSNYTTLGSIPGFTFTRASLAMGYDATGKLTYGPNNLLLQSQTFQTTWTPTNASVSSNTVAAPDGTLTADTLIEAAGAGQKYITQSVSGLATVTGRVISVYAKYAGRQYLAMYASAGSQAWFDLQNGTVSNASAIASITSVGNGWYRCTISKSSWSGASDTYELHTASVAGSFTYTGDGTSGIYLWGAQLEAVTYQTTPSTYYPTTTAAYYGPRLVYDPVTLASLGILVEEARTNVLIQSNTFTSGTWTTATNITVAAADAVSVDGATNASRLTDNTTAGVQHRLYRDYTFTSATAHTLSLFVKRNDHRWMRLFFYDGTTSFYANFDLLNGAVGNKQASTTSRITAVGNSGWYRVEMTATVAAAVGNVQIVMLGSDDTGVPSLYTGTGTSFWCYGAQLEAGTGASSPIPTTTASVTRAADVAAVTGLIVPNPHSMAAEWTPGFDNGSSFRRTGALTNAGFSSEDTIYQRHTNSFSRIYTTADMDLFLGTANATTGNKAAGRFELNNSTGSLNGAATAAPDTSTTPTTGIDRLLIGVGSGSNGPMNGTISRIRIYNRALSDAQLQAITQSLLLQEDGYSILQEDNSYIWLE